MLDRIFSKARESSKPTRLPKHLAISINGVRTWAKNHGKSLEQAYSTSFGVIKKLVRFQTKLDVPIMTLLLLSEKMRHSEDFPLFSEHLTSFFEELNDWEVLHRNQVKVSFLGMWYDLPSRIVDVIKQISDATREYDKFFLNFCVNYDGQEEIVAACKLIARQIKLGKLDVENIDKNTVKENLYTSYFLPPDVIIVTGGKKDISGILLWDSAYSKIYFTETLWPDFNTQEVIKAIELL